MKLLLLLSLLSVIAIGCHGSKAINHAHLSGTAVITGVPCQGNCGHASSPTCGVNSGTASRRIAYYQVWNSRQRSCDKVLPYQINTTGLTHLILSFAVMDPKSFEVRPMHADDEEIYEHFLALPDTVSKWVGIGGWEFSDPGPTQHTWSEMASTKDNRKSFITSLKRFLKKWNFRGIEIDWEWPGSSSRGGKPEDKQNQVSLIIELRQALGSDFGLSIVLPAQYEYLQHLDPKAMEMQLSWLSILSYDLYGPWDASTSDLGPEIRPHTDLNEIDSALQLLWGIGIIPGKVNLGIANYGRGFTVTDKGCMHYGCPFTGSSKAGVCTNLEGALSACEIIKMMKEKNVTSEMIGGGVGVKEVVWDDQWIGFDDQETLKMKLDLANDRCLGGTALWAIDYQICGGSNTPQQEIPTLIVSSASVPTYSVASNNPTYSESVWGDSKLPSEARSTRNSSPRIVPSAFLSEVASEISAPVPFQSHSIILGTPIDITFNQRSSTDFSRSAIFSTFSGLSNSQVSPRSVSSALSLQTGFTPTGVTNTVLLSSSTILWTPAPSQTAIPTSTPSSPMARPSAVTSSSWISLGLLTSDMLGSTPGFENGSKSKSLKRGTTSIEVIGSTIFSYESSRTIIESSLVRSQQNSSHDHDVTSGYSSGTISTTSNLSMTPFNQTESPTISTFQFTTTLTSRSIAMQNSNFLTYSPSLALPMTETTSRLIEYPNYSSSVFTLFPTQSICPQACQNLPWCYKFCHLPFPRPSSEEPPSECLSHDWCLAWWWGDTQCTEKCEEPKCKMFGCGCGWEGLPWGPGCRGSKLKIPWPLDWIFRIIGGLFGRNGRCKWFGCNGSCGPLGCDGFCLRPQGCDPCPKEICPCDDCGPKPGPPPSNVWPTDRPKSCEKQLEHTVTERFVYCAEVVSLSSSVSSTVVKTSTTTRSTCITPFDVVMTGCGLLGHSTTTTATATDSNTLSESSPACTRAPLSLDDDEGNNMPADGLLSSSFTFASNTSINFISIISSSLTSLSSKTPSGLVNPAVTTTHSSLMTNLTTMITTTTALPGEDCKAENCSCCSSFYDWCVKKICKPNGSDGQWCGERCFRDLCNAPNSPRICNIVSGCRHVACPSNGDAPLAGIFSTVLSLPSTTMPITLNPTTILWPPPSHTTMTTTASVKFSSPSLEVTKSSKASTVSMSSLKTTKVSPETSIAFSSSTKGSVKLSSLIPKPSISCGQCNSTFDKCIEKTCTSWDDSPKLIGCVQDCLGTLCHDPDSSPMICHFGWPCGHPACPPRSRGVDLLIPFTTIISSGTRTMTVIAPTAVSPAPPMISFFTKHSVTLPTNGSPNRPTTTKSTKHTIPTPKPMDKYGPWKVEFHQWMEHDHSGVWWNLYDPNGELAGKGGIYGEKLREVSHYIESQDRDIEHSMPFGVRVTVSYPTNVEKARVLFQIEKEMPDCHSGGFVKCSPSFQTEDKTEHNMFQIESCFDKCRSSKLVPADLWCDDLNDAMWLPDKTIGFKRDFWCGWKGF